MSIKSKLKNIKIVRKIYYGLKQKREYNKKIKGKFTLINRSKGQEKLCYILSGYKDFVWNNTFERIKQFVPSDVDVCILSSGIYKEELNRIAEQNDWSYLYTKINNISLSQNIVINEFKNAKYIFKLDEDIFITKNYFENLFNTYKYIQEKGEFIPGIISPVININGFGHMEILKHYNLLDYYHNRFEMPKYAAGFDRMIENNIDAAKFMWGEDNKLPLIDKINEDFQNNEIKYKACPIRLSIGAIMFERSLWESMKYFTVRSKKSVDLGVDETQMCDYCIECSKPIMICCNSVVGHLSFGKQNAAMKDFYLANDKNFQIGL